MDIDNREKKKSFEVHIIKNQNGGLFEKPKGYAKYRFDPYHQSFESQSMKHSLIAELLHKLINSHNSCTP